MSIESKTPLNVVFSGLERPEEPVDGEGNCESKIELGVETESGENVAENFIQIGVFNLHSDHTVKSESTSSSESE